MFAQNDPSGKFLAKSSLIVGYNLFVGIVRLILLAAASLLPPLQIGSYSSVIAFTNTKQYSSMPLKIFVPVDFPAITVMEGISFLLSDSFLGWVLVAHFAFQVFAAKFFAEGLRKKVDQYFIPMYAHFLFEFLFLIACCVAGTKFSHNMFFPLPAKTWYGVIGHCLCGLLILIIAFAATLAYFKILSRQLIEEVALTAKKLEQSANLDKVVVVDPKTQPLDKVVVVDQNIQILCKKLEDVA